MEAVALLMPNGGNNIALSADDGKMSNTNLSKELYNIVNHDADDEVPIPFPVKRVWEFNL
jgi:hypothetical protein